MIRNHSEGEVAFCNHIIETPHFRSGRPQTSNHRRKGEGHMSAKSIEAFASIKVY